jgi:general L-amino acid transport system permease protein
MLALICVVYGFPLGVGLALARTSARRVLSYTATSLIEVVRALPLVTVLLGFSIVLPRIIPSATQVDLLLRVGLALLIFNAVYFAEIIRAGLGAIPVGQSEAAMSLGLRPWTRMSLVLLPQAIHTMIPAFVVLIANVIKDTALVSVVGLFDIMNVARSIGQDPAWLGAVWEPFLFTGSIYFVICFILSYTAQRWRERTTTHK